MKFWLSKIIPVPMKSTYRADARHPDGTPLDFSLMGVDVTGLPLMQSRWWQWRGRVWWHNVERVA